eukprot:TRINITY_DN26446_c0_g1_i1.p1 TRINITY_DN26446_c0_g1~~TRINITY_DN26446_c0_g1_i1.p1  ORF type:complete len:279 (+),score=32.32 TRINITY_DN26446_c0_g1_i1:27-839(+)
MPNHLTLLRSSRRLCSSTMIGMWPGFSQTKTVGDSSNGLVIFLHGSGDSGLGIREWISMETEGMFEQYLKKHKIGVQYPSAPLRPYSLVGGIPSNVWHDRSSLSPDAPECRRFVPPMVSSLRAHIAACGHPPSRVAVFGFSMGGGMALNSALDPLVVSRDGKEEEPASVAAVAAFSSLLAKDALVLRNNPLPAEGQTSSRAVPPPPVRVYYGTLDSMIIPAWVKGTADLVRAHTGAAVETQAIPGLEHAIHGPSVMAATEWAVGRICGAC